jgi:hypothetical protein
MSNLKKINKVIIIIFMNLIPIVTIISNVNIIGPFTFNLIPFLNKISAFFNKSNNIWILSYWIIFTIIYVFSVLFSKIDFKLKIILLTAFVGTGSMLVSPIWSPRVAFFTIILFYLFSFGIIKDYVFKNRVFNAIIIFVSVLYFVVLLIMYYNVHINIEYQVSYIKDQISVKKDVIEFYDVPGRLLLSSYPYSKGYKGGYNDVYKITQDVEYKKLVCKYNYQIIFNNKRCNL